MKKKTKDLSGFWKNSKKSWLLFSSAYLLIAESGCKTAIDSKKTDEEDIQELFVSVIFNVKHAIESFIKSVTVLLEDKDLGKEHRNHNILTGYDYMMSLLNSRNFIESGTAEAKKLETLDDSPEFQGIGEMVDSFRSKLELTKKILKKYHYCEVLKKKIGNDYTIEDHDNTAFRYPQNSLKILLDYQKIVSRVTREDFQEILKDVLELKISLYIFWVLFESYSQKLPTLN